MLRKSLSVLILFTAFAVLPASLTAQSALDAQPRHIETQAEVLPAASPQCSLGIKYDDGIFNDAYSVGDGDPNDSTMVMKFDLPGGVTGFDQVCACFTRGASAPANMSYQVVIYNDNGPSGAPGTLLGTVNATASSIPVFPTTQFYSVNLASSGITLPDNSVYVGVRWPGGSLFLCGDRSDTTPQRTNYGSGNSGASWSGLSGLFPTASPRALGIRADPRTSTAACTPSPTALCLNGGRFRVQAAFETPSGLSGPAQVVQLTNDTGYLWFFDEDNVEVVVKVLNACSSTRPRYWVFAAGLTNVEVVITVTDTQSGATKTYTNPLRTPFEPVQDTSAFATCP